MENSIYNQFTDILEQNKQEKKALKKAAKEQRKAEKKEAKAALKAQNKIYKEAGKVLSKVQDEEQKIQGRDARGIQTLFRTLSKNHFDILRSIDNKASIIITVNSIIISLVLGGLMLAPAQISDNMELVRIVILILFGIASLVFAVFAINPHNSHGEESIEDTKEKRGSILYFGNFRRFNVDDYISEMNQIMDSGKKTYDAILLDMYYLGHVINRKHRYLKVAMALFLVGLALSSILRLGRTFIIA